MTKQRFSPFPKVDGTRGAPMGRPDTADSTDDWSLAALCVSPPQGTYDSGGAYWGRSPTEGTIYAVWVRGQGHTRGVRYVRAHGSAPALDKAKAAPQRADPMPKLATAFKNLMHEVGAVATPDRMYPYTVTIKGHALGVRPHLEGCYPWVAAKWLCDGDRALLDAYHQAGGCEWQISADEPPEAGELYEAYRASVVAEAEAIKAKGLPYHNAWSLKWNHDGPDCVNSLAQGIREALADA